MRVAIRADGGKCVGMGHIMRCLALANAFRRHGDIIYFFSKDDVGIDLIKKENFEVIRMPSEEQETEGFFYGTFDQTTNEASDIISLLHNFRIDILIIDHYNVNQEYFSLLKPHVGCLAYIDDENKEVYPVDVLINGNISAAYLGYRKYNDEQVLLLGPQYNMIRDEFKNIVPIDIKERVQEIMITTGGADPYHMTENFLNIFLKNRNFNDVRFNVVIGSGFANLVELIHISQTQERVTLFSTSRRDAARPIQYSKISEIMLRSDMAISAGGSTLYELFTCGVPVLAYILADNQKLLVNKMDELGYIVNLGWYNELCEEEIVGKVKDLMDSIKARFNMRAKCMNFIDGLGNDKIVEELARHIM